MIDYLILYEHKQRELNNACLLKYELERRGYKVQIACLYNAEIPGVIQPFYFAKPKVVIVPWLYSNIEIEKIKRLFKDAEFKIVNLQCEQILSQKWIEAGYHFPKEDAKKAYHVCWGERIVDRLLERGIKEERLLLTGALSIDFDHEKFSRLLVERQQLSKQYSLDSDKKWILFISSFTFAGATEEEMKELFQRTNVDNSVFMKTMIESKKIILQWLVNFAETHEEYEIIYRPHPNERSDIYLLKLAKEHSNIHVINELTVGQWIYACDYINNWISTSVVDSIFMDKNTSLLRPIEVRKYDDSELFHGAQFVDNYSHFCMFNEGKLNTKSNFSSIEKFYSNRSGFAYLKLADELEKVIKQQKDFIVSGKPQKVRVLKSIIAYLSYYTPFFANMTHNEVLQGIVKETYRSKVEQKRIEKRIKEVLD